MIIILQQAYRPMKIQQLYGLKVMRFKDLYTLNFKCFKTLLRVSDCAYFLL
jgi:hypothetical protein